MGGIGDFCHYLYHNDSIVGVVLTILCVIFFVESVRGQIGKGWEEGKRFKEKSLCIIKGTMSITRVSDFSGDSFDFEEPVGNRFGSESIGLVAEDGGPLLLPLKDCLSYGINKDKKFGKENFTIPLAVGNHKDFISALEVLERRCAEETGKSGANVIRCFYRGGRQPILYAKIDKTTEMYKDGGGDVDPMKPIDKHFYLDALIRFSSIYVSGDMVSVQVLLQEGVYLRERKAEPWKRLLRPSTGK